VGGSPFNTDVSAQVTGQISSVTGSFDPGTTGVTSVSGFVGNQPPAKNNVWMLQINTNNNLILSPPCNTGLSKCVGWQQFLFSQTQCAPNGQMGVTPNTTPCLFMEYWLYFYANPGSNDCPPGNPLPGKVWISDMNGNCVFNSDSTYVPPQMITDLNLGPNGFKMTATASAAADTLTLFTSGGHMYMNQQPSVLGLGQGSWNAAEFNVFGDCCSTQANFSGSPTLVVRTSVDSGTTDAPACVEESFTAETNNLSFGPTAPVATPAPLPFVVFTESSAGGAPSPCAAASVGDTHLTTMAGMHYDFQASGDFILAQTGPDFVVQGRQASGAPTWPNASVNKGVATRMGTTTVAVCVAPTRLEIDGSLTNLADGKSLSLPDGVTVSRRGDMYFIKRRNGDNVRVQLNHIAQPTNDWIDVSVGLGDGSQAAKVRGLLGNPDGNVNLIAMSNGKVLKEPVSFEDLYHRYGDSWRVLPSQSILCNEQKVEPGIPAKPFYATDLNPEQYQNARAICTAAGVKLESPLNDCTLDVTVLGGETAAAAFVHAPAPIAVWQVR
jgi:hypothetical protein